MFLRETFRLSNDCQLSLFYYREKEKRVTRIVAVTLRYSNLIEETLDNPAFVDYLRLFMISFNVPFRSYKGYLSFQSLLSEKPQRVPLMPMRVFVLRRPISLRRTTRKVVV